MAAKHNVFAVKLISTAIGLVSVIVGVITIPWGDVVQFGNSIIFLHEHADELEHVLDDLHEVLSLQAQLDQSQYQIDSLKHVLFETQSRDSLISVISHLNHGKFPYDSLWIKGPSGTWYKTTMEKHFTEDHE